MAPVDRTRSAAWIGLGEASTLLGIAPGTLRRWSDEGRVPVFTTPGGHRRFSRTAIAALLPANRARRPSLARLGASEARITRAYHSRGSRPQATRTPWIDAMSEEDRLAFRERGRHLVSLLLEHLDAADPQHADLKLQEAAQLAADYGRQVGALGSSMSEAVQGFLRFRSPFIDELASTARKRGLDTREATALLSDAETAMDRLLVAMMTGHSLASGPRRHQARRPERPGERSTGDPA